MARNVYICTTNTWKMKRILLAMTVFLLSAALQAGAQDIIRSSYRYNGYTYISGELEKVPCDHPFYMRLEYVGFPDNTYAWLIHMNYEDKVAYDIPKGVKMAFTTPDGKLVRAEQINVGGGERRAFTNDDGKRVYWNNAQYMITDEDLQKVLPGIKSIDVITGWEPDDYFQATFKNDEFAKALSRQYAAVKDTPKPKDEVQQEDIIRYADNNNSLTVLTRAHVATGVNRPYNVSVNYLYYKDSNKEDFDVNFMLGTETQYLIPVGSKVSFTMEDGSVMDLKQERDAYNVIYLYPTPAQTKALCKGVAALSVQTEDTTLTDTFDDNSFSEVIAKLYRTLMAVAVL